MSNSINFIGVDLVSEKIRISHVFPIEYAQSAINTSLNNNKDEIYNEARNNLSPCLNMMYFDKREVLREYAKLIFQSIINNDPYLRYEPEVGISNFAICVTTPPLYHENYEAAETKEMLTFLQEEVGFKAPIIHITKNQAICSRLSENNFSDKYFLIQIGTSTIDYIAYQEKHIIDELCWGENCGTNMIVDKLVEYGYTKADEKDENIENMRIAIRERESLGLPSTESYIINAVSLELYDYFRRDYSYSSLVIDIKMRDLVPNWQKKTQKAFSLILEPTELDTVLDDFISKLSLSLSNAAKKNKDFGFHLNKIILLEENKFPFIKEIVKKAFPNIEIIDDDNYDFMISEGAALYAQRQYSKDVCKNSFPKTLTKHI